MSFIACRASRLIDSTPQCISTCHYAKHRSKEIKMENRWQKGTHELTRHLQDCNFYHYSLQLAIYKHILQNYYGLPVSQTFIVVLHPNQDKYIKIFTENVDQIVNELFETRRDQTGAPKCTNQ